jgi:sortase A
MDDGPISALTPPSARGILRGWKIAERVLLFSGLLLLAAYGLGMAHRYLGAEAALASFDAVHPATSPIDRKTPETVDFKLWDPRRIKAYRNSILSAAGEPLSVLSISRIGVRAPVFAGVGESSLNRGLGWIPGTPKPGEPGNSGIAGHRDGFFRPLKDIRLGDTVELRSAVGVASYVVDEIKLVNPGDVGVLRPRRQESITLVTCYPFYFVGDAPQRFIVHAKRSGVAEDSVVRELGSPSGEPPRSN